MGETPGTSDAETLAAETLTVLFADICDSTRLYHDLGDTVAHNLATQGLKVVADTTAANDGIVVKTIGDGAMVTFPTVFQAYRSAIQIQEALRDGQLRLKIGLHVGPVIRADADVYGDTVNVAARVLARSGPAYARAVSTGHERDPDRLAEHEQVRPPQPEADPAAPLHELASSVGNRVCHPFHRPGGQLPVLEKMHPIVMQLFGS